MKINDVNTALNLFRESAILHGECTESGNYKLGNKNYSKIVKAIGYLKENNKRDHLLQFFTDPNLWVQLWSACYLLPLYEKEASLILKKIAAGNGIISGVAETSIQEWKKGNLNDL